MIIIVSVQLSLITNLYLLFQYILKGDKKYRKWFVLFLLANIYIMLMSMGLYIFLPSLFEDVDSTLVTWALCGLLMVLTLSTKIQIFKAISKRLKDQKIEAKRIKDISTIEKEEAKAKAEKLKAERLMLYKQIPYRHLLAKELKRQEEEERKKAGNQPPKTALELATSKEMFVFLGTMPFFLLCSAYFIAKIINFVLFAEF